jgi:hypothetical protein
VRSGPPTIPSRAPRLSLEDPISTRLSEWTRHAQLLSTEGLPIPVGQVHDLVENLRQQGEYIRAEHALQRAEGLLGRAEKDWALLRELLSRIDELKGLAERAGLDLGEFDRRLENPREILRNGRLSEGLLEQAMAAGTKSLAVLHDVMIKYFVAEAKLLGRSTRAGRDRGEDVDEATDRMRAFVYALRSGQLRGTAVAYLDLRRAVAAIPREPMVALNPEDEEQEILLEARKLARRLHRLKGSARDATSAVRLMSQVRAALSEDRRYTAPAEEIEQLWTEVDRLTRERLDARPGATAVRTSPTVTRVRAARPEAESEPVVVPPDFLETLEDEPDAPPPTSRRLRRGSSPPSESL